MQSLLLESRPYWRIHTDPPGVLLQDLGLVLGEAVGDDIQETGSGQAWDDGKEDESAASVGQRLHGSTRELGSNPRLGAKAKARVVALMKSTNETEKCVVAGHFDSPLQLKAQVGHKGHSGLSKKEASGL